MRRSFSAILDECLDLVLVYGESVEGCAARYPQFESELREALESALRVRRVFTFHPDPDRKREARVRLLEAFRQRQTRRSSLADWLGGLSMGWRRLAVSVSAVMLALVVAGTGTVLAADGSIPGDILYPAKRVGERVRLMTAFTDAREATVRTDLLARRVEELEVSTEQGRTRFVLRLAHEIQRLSARARTLAEASVTHEMDAARAALRLASQNPGVTDGGPTPQEVAVRTNPLLMMHNQFGIAEARLRELSMRVQASAAQRQIQAVADILSLHRSHTSRILERVDAIRLASGRAAGQPDEHADNGLGAVQWREVRSRVLGADLVVANGRVRLDLIVELPNGKRQRIYLSPLEADFLRGDRPGRLNDLRIGSEVVLVAHPDTGRVREVRIVP